jgi:methionine-rich copper-binding protein CopC
MARMTARTLAGGLAAAIAVILLGAGSAAAHARLVSATPAAGATLTSAPPAVRLEFDGPPYDIGLGVVVTSPSGQTMSQGRAGIVGNTVVAPLAPLTAAGTYVVAWRVVSADGHPVSGRYTFTYAPDGSTPTTSLATTSSGSGGGHAWVLLVLAVVAVIGLSVLLILPGRRRRRPTASENPLT